MLISKNKVKNIQSVERAFSILELIQQKGYALSLGEIATVVDLNKSTARRFLLTLCNLGYIDQDPNTKLYKLSTRFNKVGRCLMQSSYLVELAKPHLDALSNTTEETINLAVLDGVDVYYLDKRDTPFPLRVNVEIGGRAAVHATALGKALIAFLPEEIVQSLIYRSYPLQKYTNNTITTWTELKTEFSRIREEGVAYDNEEIFSGQKCIAAPVFQHGNPIASIGISMPSMRVDAQRFKVLKELILHEAHELTAELSTR